MASNITETSVFTTTLQVPTPGGDEGSWGEVINTTLEGLANRTQYLDDKKAQIDEANTFTAINTFTNSLNVNDAGASSFRYHRVSVNDGTQNNDIGMDVLTSGVGRLVYRRNGTPSAILGFQADGRITTTSTVETGPLTIDGATPWTNANDGTGSGLDADTVDGIEAASFAQLSGADFTGNITLTGVNYPGIFFDSQLAAANEFNLFGNASSLILRNVTDAVNQIQFNLDGTPDIEVDGDAIADYGSTSNGEYVRFYNGMQICWHYLELTYSTTSEINKVWTFPASFNSNGRIMALPTGTGTGIDATERAGSFLFNDNISFTGTTIRMRSDGLYDSGNAHGAYLYAIGTWK